MTSTSIHLRAPVTNQTRQVRIVFYYIYVALLMMAPTIIAVPARYLGIGSGDALIFTWLAINVVAVLLLLGVFREQTTSLFIALAFSAYILFSSLWSEYPQTTLAYGSTLVGILCVAYLMAVDLTMRDVLKLLARVTVFLSIVGLLLYALRFDIAVYVDAANRPNLLGTSPFKGLFPHKIVAGYYAAVGIVALLATTKRGLGQILSIGVLLAVIALSSSSTALVLLPFAVAIYLLTRRALDRGTRARNWIASLIVTAGIGGALIWWSWTDVLGILGRDATLTGRTILWDWGIRTWAERPIFGWGYAAYFETSNAKAVAATIPEFRDWDVPHFHQTYIQTAVDFGLVGLVALVIVIAKVLARSYSQSSVTGNPVAAATFAITLTAAAAGFVMYLVPSYTYTGVVMLFLFVALFSSRALRSKPSDVKAPPMRSRVAAR